MVLAYWHVALGLVLYALVSVFFIVLIPVIDRMVDAYRSLIGKKLQ
jgi:hypothetical protein